MPANYLINEHYRIEFATARGILTFEDIARHRASIVADPRFRPNFAQLIDFTNLDSLQLSAAEIETLSRPHMFAADARRVFLVATDLQFGLARMFRTYGELNDGVRNLLICRDLAEACAWVHVPLALAQAALAELHTEPELA